MTDPATRKQKQVLVCFVLKLKRLHAAFFNIAFFNKNLRAVAGTCAEKRQLMQECYLLVFAISGLRKSSTVQPAIRSSLWFAFGGEPWAPAAAAATSAAR